ncbi:ectoine/hydroxyectoine ABC transporter substrate-binding protein EhuB [Verminephrobacter aporrectodeae]|uniref:Ectoine/hydroxyectoine ABC transporter substrate-binding protein EhuB n=1 Tax=Verminephrobacter aporrectodeae subsp. tuberculatae TaxID=1110392 RepID=A0ABT3KR22_9BURK|nr:ectoine/hydroxyectoine ABC transporter substrate-binding protein EhuB [Verminephrobacter aporrectodeae]MCW5255392.1 ectoine/hydroxyectoine ABC transporter substrate-binding protein EhuB [Verminephrobacter aporrectodeae subsp. tuberculatae]MCW5320374.1 ectoine/hydroxyectoine ABC transporter substrate-binding protein EhuB [Verminephrobacter aporrectodeae subsp. tuberculatae]MCW8165838.1 ectoine/hydroxyectoine ABC transporter substrate-binding protein EhuB [Verminephrobacter aporrectodeae subsp.
MFHSRVLGLSALALATALPVLPAAHATTPKEIKDRGYVRAATANEVPYSYMKDDGSSAGIGPDVAMAVLKTMGIDEVAWSVTPFGTLIPGLKARRFDFVAAEQNISPERCRQVAFTEPNSSYGEGLLVKKGNPKKLTTYADIARDPSLKVAVVSGANSIDYLRAVGVRDSQVVFIAANADALATVQSRADAYAATELTVASLARGQAHVEQVRPFTDPLVDNKPVRNFGGFAFRPEDKAFYEAYNAALVAFRRTDAYKKILTQYGLSDESIRAAAERKVADLCAGK